MASSWKMEYDLQSIPKVFNTVITLHACLKSGYSRTMIQGALVSEVPEVGNQGTVPGIINL